MHAKDLTCTADSTYMSSLIPPYCKHRIVVLYTFPVNWIDITINHSNTDIDSYIHVLNDNQVPITHRKLYRNCTVEMIIEPMKNPVNHKQQGMLGTV